jgi:hypothetical protein
MIDSPLAQPDLGRSALRAFFGLAEAWLLTTAEQRALLAISDDTLESWSIGEGPPVSLATVDRIIDLLHIFAAIATLLPHRDRAISWMRKPNHARGFGGRPAIAVMTSGRACDLKFVRLFLDSQLM